MFRHTKKQLWWNSTALSSVLILSVISPDTILANPIDGTVVAGEASISQPNVNTVHVDQHSKKAIVNWKSFDIAPHETTRIVQPNSQAWILNRITGSHNPTSIQGRLEANGNVAIVNPDGIVFTGTSRVDVNSLIATTHDIANNDFMAGRLNFNQSGNPAASVINEGKISIGDYGLGAFVAPGVRNSGVITAKLGSVSLASGNEFSLDLYGDGLVSLAVDDEIITEVYDVATGEKISDLVKNEGTTRADGGTVALTAATARTAVNSVVNNTGIIEANTVGTKQGKIILGAQTASTKTHNTPIQSVKVSGAIKANALIPTRVAVPSPAPKRGGDIEITGEAVEVASANIEVSGINGGGNILIGGDYMGGNGDPATIAKYNIQLADHKVATANAVNILSDVVLTADAIENGNGGKVVVWSDIATAVQADISARGGTDSGDGGFVETSGKKLFVTKTASTSAPNGQNGLWLLDPVNTYIVDETTAATKNANQLINDGSGLFTPNLTYAWFFPSVSYDFTSGGSIPDSTVFNSYINVKLIEDALSAGTDVRVTGDRFGVGTTGTAPANFNTDPGQGGHVYVQTDIEKQGTKKSTLRIFADGDINFSSGTTVSGENFDLKLYSGYPESGDHSSGIAFSGAPSSVTGNLSKIDLGSGELTVSAANNIRLSASTMHFYKAKLQLTGGYGGGDIRFVNDKSVLAFRHNGQRAIFQENHSKIDQAQPDMSLDLRFLNLDLAFGNNSITLPSNYNGQFRWRQYGTGGYGAATGHSKDGIPEIVNLNYSHRLGGTPQSSGVTSYLEVQGQNSNEVYAYNTKVSETPTKTFPSTPINRPPEVVQSVSLPVLLVNSDVAWSGFTTPNNLFSDDNGANNLKISVTGLPVHIEATVNADGSVTLRDTRATGVRFIPKTHSITLTATDASGASASRNLTLKVTAVTGEDRTAGQAVDNPVQLVLAKFEAPATTSSLPGADLKPIGRKLRSGQPLSIDEARQFAFRALQYQAERSSTEVEIVREISVSLIEELTGISIKNFGNNQVDLLVQTFGVGLAASAIGNTILLDSLKNIDGKIDQAIEVVTNGDLLGNRKRATFLAVRNEFGRQNRRELADALQTVGDIFGGGIGQINIDRIIDDLIVFKVLNLAGVNET